METIKLTYLLTYLFAANVALLRPAVQCSTYLTLAASLAVDHDLTTVSCTDSDITDPWWSDHRPVVV